MDKERDRILRMVAENKITAEEAGRLLDALSDNGEKKNGEAAHRPRYLMIQVEPKEGAGPETERVNVKIPVMVLKAGARLSALLPSKARTQVNTALKDKGLDLDLSALTRENLDEILAALAELAVDIETPDKQVRIYTA